MENDVYFTKKAHVLLEKFSFLHFPISVFFPVLAIAKIIGSLDINKSSSLCRH